MDQDAFLFLLVAVTLAAGALSSSRRNVRRVLWALAPAAVLAAALTKPLPGALGVPLVLLLAATADRARLREAFVWLTAGAVGVVAFTVGALAAAGAEAGLVRLSLLDLPGAVAGERRRNLLLARVYVQHWGLVAPLLVYPLALASAIAAGRSGRLRRTSPATRQLVLGLGLFVTCELYCALTRNERQNGACFVFASLALVAAPLAVELSGRVRPAVLAAAGAVLLAVALVDAVRFTDDVSATRLVQNVSFREPSSAEQRALPPALSFLRWDLPARYRYGPGDLTRLAADLRREPGNFALVGDTTILYALADRPSAFPALFFDGGEGYPRIGARGRGAFESLLLRTLRDRHVRRVVLEDGSTWTGSTVADFPALAHAVRTGSCGRRRYAAFTVVELCRPFGEA
jgi:hypothetical protein